MKIFIFGNPELKNDSLPLEILPDLKKRFPKIFFEEKDSNEDWDMPENVLIIDTVVGIKKIKIFNSLEDFESAPRVSMHDFDALANLRLLIKLGKVKKVKIIGIPPNISKKEAFSQTAKILASL